MTFIAQNIRQKLLDKIKCLSNKELEELDALISKVEANDIARERILSFSGSFHDLEDDVFRSLTDELHKNRSISVNRIQ
jgi:hypothetical protein